MYTNESIYNNLMTILRKEKEGKTISEEQFNQLLKLASEEILNQEYEVYENSQRETDAVKSLKVEEEVELDYLGEYDLDGLTYTYWHPSYLNYTYNNLPTEIDIVTDGEWNRRLSSDLMYPTYQFPIAKLINDKLKCYPLKRENSSTNLVTNSGYTGTTDWVDSNADGLADNWSSNTSPASTKEIIENQYEFVRAQAIYMDTGLPQLSTSSNVIYENNWYYIEFDYYVSGSTPLSAFGIIDGSNFLIQITPTFDKKIKYKNVFYYDGASGSSVRIFFVCYPSAPDADRVFIIDNVFLSNLNEATKINLGYLKKPSDPYFDYYVDANDIIQYLEAGTEYTLQANETYTDKDDGTERTSGYTITAAENKTTELWLPENERPKVLYNILQKLGISLTKQDAVQYGIVKEQV